MDHGLIQGLGSLEEVTVPDGYSPPWHTGGCYVNVGDGNPVNAALLPTYASINSGDAYGYDHINLREFMLPSPIIAKNFRIYTQAASANVWRHLIYRRSDRVLIWDSGYTSTVLRGWNSYPMNDLQLQTNTPYWYAIKAANEIDPAQPFVVPKSFAIDKKSYGNNGNPPFGNLNIGFPVNVTVFLYGAQLGTVPTVLPAFTDDAAWYGINADLPIGYITDF